ncbi:hypothetical protein RchiOBHm_Chr5g0054281 [Rosa chinensis]|uniref:Uncharacterized protein n=1 Tax=Rosa chinensis TaxID=74649 RepID=A0A2P6QG42_ROSCH|nr:hypothetical protein RchiOBHm_Chr5g0054281 [Rosa chinensis]
MKNSKSNPVAFWDQDPARARSTGSRRSIFQLVVVVRVQMLLPRQGFICQMHQMMRCHLTVRCTRWERYKWRDRPLCFRASLV